MRKKFLLLVVGLLLISSLLLACKASETLKVNTISGSIDGTTIVIVKSDEYFIDYKEKEVLSQLQSYLDRKDIEIINLNTIYIHGHMVGFEIAYIEK